MTLTVPITIYDSKQLFTYGRELPPSFTVDLKDQSGTVIAKRVLRNLPGKRLTVQGKWEDKDVVMKLFFHPKRAEAYAKQDMTGVNILLNAAIPTASLLYSGATEAKGVYAIVLEYLQDAISMNSFWNSLQEKDKSTWLIKLVEFVAKQHNLCVFQRDIHWDNFVVKDEQIYALDGSDIQQLSEPLNHRQGINNLAWLLAQTPFEEFLSLQEIYKSYISVRQWESKPQDFIELGERLKLLRQQRQELYIRKIWRECTEFATEKNLNLCKIWKRQEDTQNFRQFLKSPEDYISEESVYLKRGNTSTVFTTTVNDISLVVKRYNIKSFAHHLKRCLRKTRAANSWENAHRLKLLGINTPEPKAIIEKRRIFLKCESYFIASLIDGDTLSTYFKKQQSVEDVQRMVEKVAQLFQRLYKASLSHGDLKATNIIVSKDEPFLLDLDSMKWHASEKSLEKSKQRDINRFLQNWREEKELLQLFEKAFMKGALL